MSRVSTHDSERTRALRPRLDHGGVPASVPSAMPAMAADPEPSSPITVNGFLAALRRQWLPAILLGLLLGVGGAAFAWYSIPAPYVAFAELRIDEVPDHLLFETEKTARMPTYKQTQMRMVKRPYVLAAALRRPEMEDLRTLADEPYPVEWLEENLKVSSPANEFVRVSLAGDHPAELATIVNAVAEEYLQDAVLVEREGRRKRKDELEKSLREVEQRLVTKRQAVRKRTEALQTSDSETLAVRQQMAAEYFGQVRREHARIRFEKMQAESQLALLEANGGNADAGQPAEPEAAAETPPPAPEAGAAEGEEDAPSASGTVDEPDEDTMRSLLADAPSLQPLYSRLRQLDGLRARTRERVAGDDHPAIRELDRARQRVQEELRAEGERLRPILAKRYRDQQRLRSAESRRQLEKKVALLSQQERTLRDELETQKVEAKEMGITSYELQSLQHEIAQIEKVWSAVSQQIQKLEIELDSDPRVSLHRSASPPHTPDTDKRVKLSGLAGFGLMGLVLVGFVWQDFRKRPISSAGEVVDGLSLRVLGALPQVPRHMIRNRDRKKRWTGRSAVVQHRWHESVDSTRTIFLREAAQSRVRTLMISSALGGEGKSTLTYHLAASLARSGRKVIVVDADLRRPSLSQTFGVRGDGPGFAGVLRGDCGVDEALADTRLPNLQLLTAGRTDAVVMERLSKDDTSAVLDQLLERAEFVLVDTAPVLPVNDSLMIGQSVDATVLAVRRDVSRFDKVAEACDRLAMVDVPVLGVVAIGLDSAAYTKRYSPAAYAAASNNGDAGGWS